MKDCVLQILALNSENKLQVNSGLQKKLFVGYFSHPSNPGEQYQTFLELCQDLFAAIGEKIKVSSDDPNVAAMSVLDGLKTIGLDVDYGPSKLLPGWGGAVQSVLKLLVGRVREVNGISDIRDKVVWTVNEVEIEEMLEEDGSDDEDSLEDLEDRSLKDEEMHGSQDFEKGNCELPAIFKEENWTHESERATGKLRSFLKPNDGQGWRHRLAAIKMCSQNFHEANNKVTTALEKISKQLSTSLGRVEAREDYLNNQLSTVIRNFQQCQDELQHVQARFNQVGGGITRRKEQLEKLEEDVAKLKQQLEERGQAVTDGGSVMTAQKALHRVQNDLVQLNIRLGVAQHLYIQAKLKDAQKK